MPTAIDLTNPKLTDTEANYTAEVLLAIQLLASLLDTTYATPSNQPVGTKRFNSSTGLFEQWNGSTWAALTISYLQSTSSGTQTVGGTVNFTGTVQAAGSPVATASSLATALAGYAPLASPAFTGTPSLGGSTLATQSWVSGQGYATTAALSSYATTAMLASCALTGGSNATGTWPIAISGLAAKVNAALSGGSGGYIGIPINGNTFYLQWAVQSVASATTSTYSFPITFPNAALGIVTSNAVNSITGTPANVSTGASLVSTSQYQLRNGTGTGIGVSMYMLAVGY